MADMTGKTVLVTGATNGIGLETAKTLAAMGAQVILHGRSTERGQAALNGIAKEVPGARIDFIKADFSSLASVKNLAEEVLDRFPKLDVMINNAGGANVKRTVTADGFEMTFGVNHLAPFYLTNLLLDRIKTSAPARIVNVASSAHRGGRINFDNLNMEKHFSSGAAYGQSKLANVLFTRSLAKRLAGTEVTANALHPGVVRTGFFENITGALKLFMPLFRSFMISAEEGAKTSIYLASSPEVKGVNGEYFARCQRVTPSARALDDAVAERLWAVSAQMTGVHSGY